jgi:PIN domain nuclease of toxin-antitoxin system
VRLLLDTHVVLWQLSGVRDLGRRAHETIAGAAELVFSVVSFR